MPVRNLNPHTMFVRMAGAHTPKHHFQDSAPFADWKREALPEVIHCLGAFPERVDPNPELVVEWTENGLRKQRWIIDVQRDLSASMLVCMPETLGSGDSLPAIFCWHGHGAFGKESVMGNDKTPERAAEISAHNYNYGEQMARAGYVTYAIDWIGAGERHPDTKPNSVGVGGTKDWCNLLYLNATMFGMTSLSINVQHGKAATDVVSAMPEVDARRLGVMGLSGGGTMTTWTYLCDDRFCAAEIICYCDLWEVFGMRDLNYCGMQVAPGLYTLVDLPDLQGLLAPKPLLIDIGVKDTCFHIDSSMDAYRQIERIYKAAGAEANLELDLHPNEHAWGGNKSVKFFGTHLRE